MTITLFLAITTITLALIIQLAFFRNAMLVHLN